MALLKLTKNELREQQKRLGLLQKYLPTLQLKKAMLQFEVSQAALEIAERKREWGAAQALVEEFAPLMNETASDILRAAQTLHVDKQYENIAGVEIPSFEQVTFHEADYFLPDTPAWADRAVELLRDFVTCRERVAIAEEKRRALERELREVSIRVNLFEKILIPRSLNNIKKIRVFLGDQQLSAVAQAKVAKSKIEKAKTA